MSEFESNSIDSSSNDTVVSDNASHSDNSVSENTTNSSPTNNIFVGKKPVMSYAMSGLIQLGQTGEIVIKGRGMVISRAVDVAQIITERLGKGKYSTKSIKIDTDVLGEDDNKRNVSTIEIIIGTS
ncbi:MAG: DNA-binding protein [Thaumarchaeota archaeon]|nr:DNA-binding protein [Nitrososphaerota archaeon]|tara:strand:- start:23151 stop:23528 length:378 start_codon:yes stop_codon:yes gene_type:complete